jgi:hypothetical protein
MYYCISLYGVIVVFFQDFTPFLLSSLRNEFLYLIVVRFGFKDFETMKAVLGNQIIWSRFHNF